MPFVVGRSRCQWFSGLLLLVFEDFTAIKEHPRPTEHPFLLANSSPPRPLSNFSLGAFSFGSGKLKLHSRPFANARPQRVFESSAC